MFRRGDDDRLGVGWGCTTFEYVSLHFDFFPPEDGLPPPSYYMPKFSPMLGIHFDVHVKGFHLNFLNVQLRTESMPS